MMVNNQVINKKQNPDFPAVDRFDLFYSGHGKLLLSGEYFVIDGAKAIALPTKKGQSLGIRFSPSFNPKLTWKSYDLEGKLWFEGNFEFWHFDCLDKEPSSEALFLQKILQKARAQNKHFLRDEVDVFVETFLDFPLEWGLGSSSTLIYNIAQWAYVSPFELSFNTNGGSGYDIACAQSKGPILYQRVNSEPHWSFVTFDPPFKENLFFVYLGKKQDSRQAVSYYLKKDINRELVVKKINEITEEMIECQDVNIFSKLVKEHERLISASLDLPAVKDLYFQDYWGEVKSLGAWGGDFVMMVNDRSSRELYDYLNKKGFQICFSYEELILNPDEVSNSKNHDFLH